MCLRNGIVCTEIQIAVLSELRKSRTLVNPERQTSASAEALSVYYRKKLPLVLRRDPYE